MRTLPSLEYRACHEAGHSLVRYLNGERLILVDAVEQVVNFVVKELHCSCGGYLLLGDGETKFNLAPDCENCTKFAIDAIAGCYAGEVATGCLIPGEHDPQDAEYDHATIAMLHPCYKKHEKEWAAIKLTAWEKAESLIQRERLAVLSLRDELVSQGGRLDGCKAETIISANLVPTPQSSVEQA
jgi:hypothetical protein